MLRRIALPILLALALAPAAVRADVLSIGLELYGGYNKYDSLGLKSGVASVNLSDKALLKSANSHAGLIGTLKLGLWEFGALVENGWSGGSSATTTVGALVGPAIDFSDLRLEILGELGGRRYGTYLNDSAIPNPPSGSWLTYAGLRPGLSYRFGTVLKLMVGIWVFARWDVTTKTVSVATTSGTDVYKLGGSTFGASGRFGISF